MSKKLTSYSFEIEGKTNFDLELTVWESKNWYSIFATKERDVQKYLELFYFKQRHIINILVLHSKVLH